MNYVPRPRKTRRPNWRIALVGVPFGLLLLGIGIVLGLDGSGTAAAVLICVGAALIGGSAVMALAPAMQTNAKPSEHLHYTFDDIVGFIDRAPHSDASKRQHTRSTEQP